MPHVENERIVETPNEARAAVTGHNVRYVLVASTVVAAALLVGVFLYFFV